MVSEGVVRTFPADAASLSEIRRFIRERAREGSVPREALSDVLVAVTEACTNVIRHAGVQDLNLRWRVDGSRLEVEVEDSGVYVDRPREPNQAGGFGIALMRSLMDEVTILRGHRGHPGTRVLLVKRLSTAPASPFRSSRTGLRTRRLHRGAPVHADNEAGRAGGRRIPRLNAVGMAAVAAAVVALGVIGGLAVVHQKHPKAALASNRSPAATHPKTGGTAPPASPQPSRHQRSGHRRAGHRSSPFQSPRTSTRTSPSSGLNGSSSPAVLPHVACPSRNLLGVYAPARFDVLAACDWVTGKVTSLLVQKDGNSRITVTGPNQGPVAVEIILGQRLPSPRVGERIAAFGTLVRNLADGWTGLEPTWAIQYGGRGKLVQAQPPAVPEYHPGEVCVPATPPLCAALPTPSVSVATPSLPAVP